MPTKRTPVEPIVYQLLITLAEVTPPVWRRVLVTGDTSLHHLHWVVQAAMGWTNSHLHQFRVGDDVYSQLDFGLDEDEDYKVKNERTAKLGRLGLEPHSRFIYEYDFGDSWHHEIEVEAITKPDDRFYYPLCVAGERACPPEDCGGVWGYANFKEAIRDPEHEEHDQLIEWIGGIFDPDGFDVNAANREICRLVPRR